NLTASTGAGGGAKTDDSLGWRIGYWGRVAPFFNQNPLSGIGLESTKTLTIEAKDPHNSFLQAFIEGGILGGFGFIALLAVITVASRQVWKMAKRGELSPKMTRAGVGSIAAVFTVAAQLLTENVLLNTIVWWYLDMAIALVAVLAFRQPRPADTPKPTPSRLELPAAGQTTIGAPT
ncbi:MAG: O-antigen ligase family protein, partial [Acidimicrobiales bacterium]